MSNIERRPMYKAALEQELISLEERGVRFAGNGFSPLLVVTGTCKSDGVSTVQLLSEAEDKALRAAFLALGWAPEDFCVLAASTASGELLGSPLFREAVEALDPEAIVLLDGRAADAMRGAYAEELAAVESFEAALIPCGVLVSVLGRRVLSLGDFSAALTDGHAKQQVWAYLKQLPPLGAPY